MAKIEDGASGAILAGVDAGSRALRVTPRPIDALGHYRIAGSTGAFSTLAGYSELLQFRWSDSTSLALIQNIRFRLVQLSAFTTPQEMSLELITAQSYTQSGGGGFTTIGSTPTFRKRASFPVSRVGDLRYSNTAALILGNRTTAANPIMTQAAFAAGPGTVIDGVLEMPGGSAEYPLVLAQNEGFILRLGQTSMGAGGTARLLFELAWTEVSAGTF